MIKRLAAISFSAAILWVLTGCNSGTVSYESQKAKTDALNKFAATHYNGPPREDRGSR